MHSMRVDFAVPNLIRYAIGVCAVACLLCPATYFLRGTIVMVSWWGNVVMLVPLALSEIWLVRRLLFGKAKRPVRAGLIVLDVVSAIVVVLFFYIAANLLFVQRSWMAGFAAVDFLVACVFAVPVVYWRRHVLAARLAWLPAGAALVVFVLVMLVAAIAAASLWVVPPVYI